MKNISRYHLFFVLMIYLVLLSNKLILSSSNSSYILSEMNNEIETLEDIDILTILDDGYGLTYFQAKEFFKSLNCNFWTTGQINSILSCPYNPNETRFTEPVNLTIDKVDVTDYDCIFIPSGPHWKTLMYSEEVLKLLVQTREHDILLSSLCIGTYVLAAAEVLKGVKVLGHDLAKDLIEQGGSIYCANDGYRVISHNGIITGGIGNKQNTEGGYFDAPTIELCKTIAKELLGGSFFVNAKFEANNIEVETQDLSDFNENILNITEITNVMCSIYHNVEGKRILDNNITLNKTSDNKFVGTITDISTKGKKIDIEILNEELILEITSEPIKFSSDSIPGFGFLNNLVLLIIITIIMKQKKIT